MRTDITYTVSPCSLGFVLLAAGDRGICHLRLGDSGRELRREFSSSLPEARGVEDHSDLEHQSEAVAREIDNWRGRGGAQRFELGLEGTPFQRRVWQGLCEIPFGETRTYAGLARTLDLPGGARAVAGACARNPVAVLFLAIVCCPKRVGLEVIAGVRGERDDSWNSRIR
jgi:AraC family transcriptional regulator of adaptative response/methylated-DNA-[protein]-cysteine methyltransferase